MARKWTKGLSSTSCGDFNEVSGTACDMSGMHQLIFIFAQFIVLANDLSLQQVVTSAIF